MADSASRKVFQSLWVHLPPNKAPVKVSTDGCEDIDDFIKSIKLDLFSLYGEFPAGEISLHHADDEQLLLDCIAEPDLFTKKSLHKLNEY